MESTLIGRVHETELLILNQKGNFNSSTFNKTLRANTRYCLEIISSWKEGVLFFCGSAQLYWMCQKNQKQTIGGINKPEQDPSQIPKKPRT